MDKSQPPTLVEELLKIGTLGRIIDYGPFDTLKLGLSRFFNHEVNSYFEDYLEELDKTVIFFNDSPYRVNIDRYTLGELYNKTKLDTMDREKFFIEFFQALNLITLEVIKAGIDEIYDHSPAILKGVNSLRSINRLNYESEHFDYLQNIITKYYITVANKPFSLINIISPLKRFRLDTAFISTAVKELETEVIKYIRIKYSVGDRSSYSLLTQTDAMSENILTDDKYQKISNLIKELRNKS